MKTITVGMIKSFLECPYKYNFIYNEHLDFPSDDVQAEMGKKLHSLINYYYKGYNISKIIKADLFKKDEQLTVLWQNFLNSAPKNVINSEFVFNTKLSDNYRLTGRVDALQKTSDGYAILDWKTGKSSLLSENSAPQTMVYMYCFYKILSEKKKIKSYENLSMKYIFLSENNVKTVKFNEERFFEFEKFLIEYSQKISDFDKTMTPLKNSCKDFDNCKYSVFCKEAFLLF